MKRPRQYHRFKKGDLFKIVRHKKGTRVSAAGWTIFKDINVARESLIEVDNFIFGEKDIALVVEEAWFYHPAERRRGKRLAYKILFGEKVGWIIPVYRGRWTVNDPLRSVGLKRISPKPPTTKNS